MQDVCCANPLFVYVHACVLSCSSAAFVITMFFALACRVKELQHQQCCQALPLTLR